jgi:hypothetical protein
MHNDLKHLPPRYIFEDMPVDVALVQSCQSLNQNINKYSAKQANALYIVTAAAGSVAQAYTGSGAGNQFLCTVGYRMPVVGNILNVALQYKVSSADTFDTNIFLFDENTPYIKNTADLLANLNNAFWVSNQRRNSISTVWTNFEIDRQDWPAAIQVVVSCKNIAAVSATYSFYAASCNWRYDNE